MGSINIVFVLAIAFGMFMILFTMILNIINSVKCKDKENTWFSQNSVTGFVFYGSLVVMIFLVMGKSNRLATVLPGADRPDRHRPGDHYAERNAGKDRFPQKAGHPGRKGHVFCPGFL